MNRTIEQWSVIAEHAGNSLLIQAISDLQRLARQLETERASLFAESQRKQQLEQQCEELMAKLNELKSIKANSMLVAEFQRDQLLYALELLLCDIEQADYMTAKEREREARAIMQKVENAK